MKKYIEKIVNKIKTYNQESKKSVVKTKIEFVTLGFLMLAFVGVANTNTYQKDSIKKVPIQDEMASLYNLELPNVAIPFESMYIGVASQELLSLGFTLDLVENPNEIMDNFNGKMYTKETSNCFKKNFSTSIKIDDVQIDMKKVNSFSQLESCKKFSKSSDLNGDAYYVSENNKTKFFTRGIQSVLLENGSIFYVFIANMNDYEYCKDLQISMLDGITIDSTITDVVNILGKPKCVDVYEVENEKPYILCYYVDESKSNEISLIFVCDENTKNGYYLSEVTMSMTENN